MIIDWERALVFTSIIGLGLTCAMLGIGWSTNNDRLNVLSKRIYDLEQITVTRELQR